MLEAIAMETLLKSFPTVTPSNQVLSFSVMRCFNLKCCVDTCVRVRACVWEEPGSESSDHRTPGLCAATPVLLFCGPVSHWVEEEEDEGGAAGGFFQTLGSGGQVQLRPLSLTPGLEVRGHA